MLRLLLASLIAASGLSCDGSENPEDCPNGICTGDGDGDGDGDGCAEAWVCTPWETNGADDQGSRTCVDENACGTEDFRPVETATLPALDENFYRCNVEPIMDAKCSQLACHGTEDGRALRIYARGRLRITGEVFTEPGCLQAGTQHPSEECIGSIECRCWTLPHSASEWQRNYDSARGFGLDVDGVPLAAGDEASSELIAQPVVGGKAHAGIHLFRQGDADYTTLVNWLSGATLATCNSTN